MKRSRRTISAAEFKARCLAILDQVAANKDTVIVTKRGRPVAKVVAALEVEARPLRGSVRVRGDLLAPIDEPWDAAR